MRYEESRVGRSLAWPWAASGRKEWWYHGVHDPVSGAYFSFFFIRMPMMDSFRCLLFRPGLPAVQAEWKGWLRSRGKTGAVDLEAKSGSLHVRFSGSAETGWTLHLESSTLSADVGIQPGLPPFLRREEQFQADYTLLHFFGNRVEGTVWAGSQEMSLRGPGYGDHCFGLVPRRSGWHWLAVQDERYALSVLRNVGPYAQNYAQAYDAGPSPESGRWIRLDPTPLFELDSEDPWARPWKVVGPDLDLEVKILSVSSLPERIPPLVPIVVKLDHEEAHVQAMGRLRLDGNWREVGPLHGVLERHHGTW